MERATGWYKKNTQFILFVIGLLIAVIFNIDSIKIADKLQKDPKIREQIVMQANAFLENNPNLKTELDNSKSNLDSLLTQINEKNTVVNNSQGKMQIADSLNIENYKLLTEYQKKMIIRADSLINTDIQKANSVLGLGWDKNNPKSFSLMSILGWIITALAISLGAPFWYDLLNKFMKLRGSVNDSASAKKEKN
jgi:hypothetical protein